ncbi:FtsX-like permease family protein, partial [candidate division GN15 bacterium]|nr:FtsX-like permease family protein [candidate division GN15 bacterium]
MTLRDLIGISAGNLYRMKLRTTLTAMGIVVAIGAFTGMLSFGVGNQAVIEEQFEKLDLFSTLLVYPPRGEDADTAGAPVLNAAMVDTIAALPNVELAYPWEAFDLTVSALDTTIESEGQALPASEFAAGRFSDMQAGSTPEAGSMQVVITDDLLESLGIEEADSALGVVLELTVEQMSVDSAVSKLIEHAGERVPEQISQIRFDSLRYAKYREAVLTGELKKALQAFSSGFFESPTRITDTFTVVGVLRGSRGRNSLRPIVMPEAVAQRLNTGGLGTDPMDLMSALQSGKLFESAEDIGQSYSQVTVKFDRTAPYQPLKDTIQALGFRTYSFAEQFEEIRRFFFYFDLALGAVGLLALVTASLGIINTMLMAITERRKEIGVIKSLGADERDIKLLFVVESAVIGFLGSAVGVFLGWVGTRIASEIAKGIMRNEGAEPFELFATPWWLVLLAIGFGI